MRVVLVGTVQGSLIAFNELVSAGCPPVLVVTLPSGLCERHSDFVDLQSPARLAGCAVFCTSDINAAETIAAVAAVEPDLLMVIGWSQICRAPIRSIAKTGTIGYHPSALPRLRGRGVIPWTILLEEKSTGSTLFWIDEGIDSGPILSQDLFAVCETETARSLYDKHMQAIARLVPKAIRALEAGTAARIDQRHELASYCAKRTPDDGLISWHQPAYRILTLVRAVGEPYPGAFTYSRGRRVFIDSAVSYRSGRYFGLCGQVQAHTGEGFLVMCGDGQCIEVLAFRSERQARPSVHSKLDDVALPDDLTLISQEQVFSAWCA